MVLPFFRRYSHALRSRWRLWPWRYSDWLRISSRTEIWPGAFSSGASYNGKPQSHPSCWLSTEKTNGLGYLYISGFPHMGGQHVMALSENVVFWQSELGQMLNHESLGCSSFHQRNQLCQLVCCSFQWCVLPSWRFQVHRFSLFSS